jgi:hypothetical protein
MKEMHIEGWLNLDGDDNLRLKEQQEYYRGCILAGLIAEQYEGITREDVGDLGGLSLYIPECELRFYTSDTKLSLEQVQEEHLKKLFGAIDVYGENYGYSEWTITGFNVEKLTIGNHDLNEILKDYLDKYIHIIIKY